MNWKTSVIVIVCFFLGSLIGWSTYKCLVKNAYQDLEEEIRTAPLFESLFADDPAILHLIYEHQRNGEDQQLNARFTKLTENIDVLVWRILRTQGIIRGDDGLNKVGILLAESLSPILINDLNYLTEVSGVEFLTTLITGAGRAINRVTGTGTNQSDSLNNLVNELVIDCLSAQPHAFDNYLDALQESETNLIREVYYGRPRQLFTEEWGKKATMSDLLSLLYSNFSVSNAFDELDQKASIQPENNSKFNAQDNIEEYRQMTQFASKLIIGINNHPNVSKARNWLSVVEGPMQCLMIIVFLICAFLLITLLPKKLAILSKSFNRLTLQSDEEYGLKRTYRWGVNTLPVFGFIGTILGLMAALGDAYKIPLASNETSSAIAISDITNTLSIAFTTTLMAFVLNVILSLLALIILKKDVEDELQQLNTQNA